MTLEKCDHLLAICPGSVMFLLVADISTGLFNSGDADAECTIALLPRTLPQCRKGCMNPFRRIALDQLYRLRDGHRRGETEKDVHVIGHSADRQGFHSIRASDATEIRPETLANRGREPCLTFFGREDAMVERTRKGMHSAVPFGTLPFVTTNPSAKALGYSQNLVLTRLRVLIDRRKSSSSNANSRLIPSFI